MSNMHQWHAAKASLWVTKLPGAWIMLDQKTKTDSTNSVLLAWDTSLEHRTTSPCHALSLESNRSRWCQCSTSVSFEVQDSWLLGWGVWCHSFSKPWFGLNMKTPGSYGNTGMDRNLWIHKLDVPYSFQIGQLNFLQMLRCLPFITVGQTWCQIFKSFTLKDVLSFPSLCCYRKQLGPFFP